jgi:hypothetical protein
VRDPDRLDDLMSDWAMEPDSLGNIIVHRGPHIELTLAPMGLLIADLSDWTGAAETGAANWLLASFFGETLRL